MHHRAIAADVDPTFVRVSRDDDMTRADVSTAVSLLPERNGEFEKIDVISFVDVLHHRTRRYFYRRYRRPLRPPFAASLHESFPRDVQGQVGWEGPTC